MFHNKDIQINFREIFDKLNHLIITKRRIFWLTLVVILLTVVGSAIGFIYSSNFAPLLVGFLVIAPILVVFFLRKPEWALYAAIFIVFIPLGIIPDQMQSNLNRGSVILVFACWAFYMLTNKRPIRVTPEGWFFLGFVVFSFITLFWAEDFGQALTILQTYILRWVLYLFLAVNLIDTKKKLDGFLYTIAISGVLLMITSAFVVLTEGYVPGSRLKVLGMNENETAVKAVTALVGVLWWGSHSSKSTNTIKTLIVTAYFIMSIALIAMTGSRGGLLSLVAAIFAFVLWKPTRKWGLIIIAMGIIGLLVTPFVFTTVIERFDTSGTRGDTTLGGREGLWQAARLMILDNFWKGVGIGNAPTTVIDYMSDPSVQSVILPTQIWNKDSASIHGPILMIFGETGIFGFLFYIGTMLIAAVRFFINYLKTRLPEARLYFSIVSSIYAGYLVSWVKGGGSESEQSFFLFLVLLIFLGQVLTKDEEKEIVVSPQATDTLS